MKNSITKKRVDNAIKHAMKKRNQINQNQIHLFKTLNAFVVDQSYYEIFIIAMTFFFIVIDYSLQSF